MLTLDIHIGINPVVFLGVRWYGILVALGIMTLVLWTLWQVKKGARYFKETELTTDARSISSGITFHGLPLTVESGLSRARSSAGIVFSKVSRYSYDLGLTAALVGIPSGIVFSKVLHIIDYIVVAKTHPELVASGAVIDYTAHPGLMFNGAGLTIEGAILGAFLGIWIYSRFDKKFRFGYFVDTIAPGILLAQAIGRVGCTINGCCYGVQTSAPFGIVYTNSNSYAPLGISFIPTQVFEIVYDLAIFGILVSLKDRFKPEGSLFMIYLSLYAVWRLGIDFIREGNPFLFGLHEVQVVSIIILLITIPRLVLKTRWISRKPVPTISQGVETA